jgi:hypothetical protein
MTREEGTRRLLCEGQSIRAVSRITGASKITVTNLVVDAGRICSEYRIAQLRSSPNKRVQAMNSGNSSSPKPTT